MLKTVTKSSYIFLRHTITRETVLFNYPTIIKLLILYFKITELIWSFSLNTYIIEDKCIEVFTCFLYMLLAENGL
jgi:hypothetical protein